MKWALYIFSLFCTVNCSSYFITLRDNESFDDFYANDMKYPEPLRVRDQIRNIFTIGKFKGFVGDFSKTALERLSRCPYVSEITPDITFNALEIQVQPYAPRHLARISSKKKLKKNLVFVYDDVFSGQGVNAYIVDSGIKIEHPQFEGRAYFGRDFTGLGSGDTNGHGTHVAGLVGSQTYGVAKNVNLIEVRALGDGGSGSLSTIIAALEFAVNHRRRSGKPGVANLSLGSVRNSVLNRAIDAAVEDDLVVVAAAGNTNTNACKSSPGSAIGAITVGSIDDSSDAIAGFSNWGECVDIFAPGAAIKSVDYQDLKVPKSLSGTSMSAPIVSGIVANLLSAGVPPSDVKTTLLKMATNGKVKRTSLLLKGRTPNKIAHMGLNLPDAWEDKGEENSDADTDYESGSDTK
ncbi:hypothetical protein PSN45_000914 [Yamadazyma tenuis]|uniref:Peptidase S8/S53 domain-containing protein n=1 Tax=Candida tenuis (strain ATCC 10573 / BCRC 21748 / CBS 615 / JCM 9827 / NBRC 10315 / NRRL Y-1498 / VKM Y-70) TaxID=590646 RepID=G3BBN6_CANTC|nr:uncharacterized protein CANTEDRAFT_99249 [Yamadazyma tenuis ATCC 10573]EGV62194.1 hypothetical protein CANTEDRAFT_99249 [Yamadazyma tenuis ATCC 10573]WEJ93451.1 hypothetical protein PSN45_000914 [Yamadazyma tenuis]